MPIIVAHPYNKFHFKKSPYLQNEISKIYIESIRFESDLFEVEVLRAEAVFPKEIRRIYCICFYHSV